MRMIITLGSLLLAAAPAAALPGDTDSFLDAKTGYRVDISHQGDVMVLDGINRQSHGRFHIAVAPGGRVKGVYEGRKIDYVMGEAAMRDTQVADNSAR